MLQKTTLGNLKEFEIGTVEDVKKCPVLLVDYSPEMFIKVRALKEFLQANLYSHYRVERMRLKATRYIKMLFQAFMDNHKLLPDTYKFRIDKGEDKSRVVCDYIAGMTDRFALDEYKKLFEPYERV